MSKEAIVSHEIAAPVGPYSHAVRSDGLIFLSGQAAQSPSTGRLIAGDVSAQTEQTLQNLTAVLRAAGKSLTDVLRVGVYLTDMKDFPQMNAVYERHFNKPYPARTTVAVAGLPLGAAVEIDLVAR